MAQEDYAVATEGVVSTESEVRDWRGGHTLAERLCAGILIADDYKDVDPQAPWGGSDGKKDIVASRAGLKWVAAVFFPATIQAFSEIKAKFESGELGVARNDADGFVFFVNQHLTVEQRATLLDLLPQPR